MKTETAIERPLDEIVIRQRHPAKYSDVLLPVFIKALEGHGKILDPFAGTGKLRMIRPDAFLLEIEPEWAAISGATVGDALAMPWEDGTFDAVCTSPTYGNRMADHFTDHQKDKNYTRNTYRHALGRPLTKNNSGGMQWGDKYREFHEKAWIEVWRVLQPGGKFILNVSDHIRKGIVQEVTKWHKETAEKIGFVFVENIEVKTQRQRQGRNGEKRVNCENVMIFSKLYNVEISGVLHVRWSDLLGENHEWRSYAFK